MCLMCIEIAKGSITTSEVKRALPEMISAAKTQELTRHYQELERASEEKLKEIATLEAAKETFKKAKW